jgi:hypothetical protein
VESLDVRMRFNCVYFISFGFEENGDISLLFDLVDNSVVALALLQALRGYVHIGITV